MEKQTYIKHLRTSPKKLRLTVANIRAMSPVQALDVLFYSPKRASKILYKAIKSAVENSSSDLKSDKKGLKFKILAIEEGSRLKRFRSGGRGTIKRYRRPTAHIKVVLTNNT